MLIEAKGINKEIKGKQILSNVTLSFSGIYGLLGPNGAGKTTLMRILASLTSFDGGSVLLDGKPIHKKKYVNQMDEIGYLPQDFMIYPELALYEVLEHIAILQGESSFVKYDERIKKVVEQVNLTDHLWKKMNELSGGMRRRAGIAQLLLREPKILLFDEPTAGLDIEERVRFRNLLKQLGKKHTIIVSSHIVEDIEFLCNKIGVIKDGTVLFEGTPSKLKAKAAHCTYEINVHIDDLDELIRTEQVVQIHETNSDLIVRILSDRQIGKQVTPRLMDGYISLLKEVSYEENRSSV